MEQVLPISGYACHFWLSQSMTAAGLLSHVKHTFL